MKKAIFLIPLLFLIGCTSVARSISPIVPRLEMGAAEKGFNLQIDPVNLGVNTFCLEPDGAPAKWLDKSNETPVVNIFTNFVKYDLFGVCPTVETTVPTVE